MYFEKIRAIAFGPLRDKVLELAPGFNVVFGPNEAGKSTWHAAIYAGLCGVRRGKGREWTDDKAFRDRHRPWRGGHGFRVGVQIALEDERARRVELIQDLENRVAERVSDMVLPGRDYADEIDYEGAPDGSKWLGLTRENFLRTACIRQTETRRVAEEQNAEGLQQALQEAATAGSQSTPTAAVGLIEKYRTDEIGSERAPTKPFRMARDRMAELRDDIREAQEQRAEGEELQKRLEAAQRGLDHTRWMLAERRALAIEEQLRRAEAMDRHFPDGRPGPSAAANELRLRVREVIADFEKRPDPARHSESRLHEIDSDIADSEQARREGDALLTEAEEVLARCRHELEARQDADQKLAGEVARGAAELEHIDQELDRLDSRLEEAKRGGSSERDALRRAQEHRAEIAQRVESIRVRSEQTRAERARLQREKTEAGAAAMGLAAKLEADAERFESVQRQIDEITQKLPDPPDLSEETRQRKRPRGLPAILAGMMLLAGAGLTVFASTPAGPRLLLVGAAALALWAFLVSRRTERRPNESPNDEGIRHRELLKSLHAERAEIAGRKAQLDTQRDEFKVRLGKLRQDLEEQEAQERRLEDERRETEAPQQAAQGDVSRRQIQMASLQEAIARHRADITSLSGRQAESQEAQEQREASRQEAERKVEACRQDLKDSEQVTSDHRADIGAHKTKREELLKSRSRALKDLERRRAEDTDTASDAERQLRQVGQEVLGEEAATPNRTATDVVRSLRDWQQRQEQAQANDQERFDAYTKYREFVGVQGIGALRDEAQRQRTQANELSAAAPEAERPGRGDLEEANEADLQLKVDDIRGKVHRLEVQLEERQRLQKPLADLEDDLEAEEGHLHELTTLDAALVKAVEHLKDAEERVYRDLAPKLQTSVEQHLSQVTGGKYEGCKIDPDTLAMEVQSPGTEPALANGLSLGSQEQIYLLLRFALAEHLTRLGQRCPLILDDVLAAADAARKRAILDTLLVLGDETQVVLFTHEDDVLQWARHSLVGDRHELIELDPPQLAQPA